jgi:hypothetical protein
MSRKIRKSLLVALPIALLICASAYAIESTIGNTKLSATATMLPRELPAKGGAPITLSSVTRVGSIDKAPPQVLSSIDFRIDKHGFVETKGVPVCTTAKLEGTTPSEARKRCAGALVGKGIGKAQVNLPGQPRMEISSPLSFFNGPKVGGRPSLIVHAYETVPAVKTLLVPITIEKISNGRYGYRVQVDIPEIAGGYGAATLAEVTVGRTWKRGGKKVGYLTAYCAGGRLQVHGAISFENGDFFPATLTSACHVPG